MFVDTLKTSGLPFRFGPAGYFWRALSGRWLSDVFAAKYVNDYQSIHAR